MLRAMMRVPHPSTRLLTALLITVFLVLPVADAAACADEVAGAESVMLVHIDAHADEQYDGAHGHCAQGHCHHAAHGLPFALPTLAQPIGHAPRDDAQRIAHSHRPDGLTRPPRA